MVAKGEPHPLFHVSYETVQPCRSLKTRSFAEVRGWKIGRNEVWHARAQAFLHEASVREM